MNGATRRLAARQRRLSIRGWGTAKNTARWLAPFTFVPLLLLLALGSMGVAYGLWSEALIFSGDVFSGTMDVQFSGVEVTEQESVVYQGDGNDGSGQAECNTQLYGPDGDSTIDVGPDLLEITVTNAYPSYHCWVTFHVQNVGSTPVHVEEPVCNAPSWVTLQDCYAYSQVHPGESVACTILIHFTEGDDVEPNTTYDFDCQITAYQWNESP
jgi:hypothetical protein